MPEEIKRPAEPLKNWKVRSELLRFVNIECAMTGATQAQMAEAAWDAYKNQRLNPPSAISSEHQKWHDLLERIFESGDPSGIHTIQSALMRLAPTEEQSVDSRNSHAANLPAEAAKTARAKKSTKANRA